MVNFTKTTLQKEGILQDGDITYSISLTAVNNELTRLYCGITKKTVVQATDAAGNSQPVEQPISIGHITLDHGRTITEANPGESILPHLTKFQEILDEVLGKTPTT